MRQANLIMILAVLLAASACRSDQASKSNSTPGNVNNSNTASTGKEAAEVKPSPQPPMPVMSLLSEFQKDQVAAEKKYNQTWVVVTGPVWRVDKDNKGFPTINFLKPGSNPDKKIELVICTLNRDQEGAVLALKKGDQVTLRGKVVSYTFGTVWVYNCTIQ